MTQVGHGTFNSQDQEAWGSDNDYGELESSWPTGLYYLYRDATPVDVYPPNTSNVKLWSKEVPLGYDPESVVLLLAAKIRIGTTSLESSWLYADYTLKVTSDGTNVLDYDYCWQEDNDMINRYEDAWMWCQLPDQTYADPGYWEGTSPGGTFEIWGYLQSPDFPELDYASIREVRLIGMDRLTWRNMRKPSWS